MLKVFFPHPEDVVSWDQVLHEQVAVFFEAPLHFKKGNVFWSWAKLAEVFIVDCAFIRTNTLTRYLKHGRSCIHSGGGGCHDFQRFREVVRLRTSLSFKPDVKFCPRDAELLCLVIILALRDTIGEGGPTAAMTMVCRHLDE